MSRRKVRSPGVQLNSGIYPLIQLPHVPESVVQTESAYKNFFVVIPVLLVATFLGSLVAMVMQ